MQYRFAVNLEYSVVAGAIMFTTFNNLTIVTNYDTNLPVFRHTCATFSELPSNKSIMCKTWNVEVSRIRDISCQINQDTKKHNAWLYQATLNFFLHQFFLMVLSLDS